MNPILAATQTIIVYRSPMEQALWETDVGAYIILGIVSAVALIGIVEAFSGGRRK